MRELRAYLPAVVLLVGAGFIWNTRTQEAVPLAAPITTVLADLPGYQVQEQRLTDAEREVAGMSQYVARVYSRDSAVAFTTFVSYYERQTQGKTIHSPRNCLPGAGWEVLNGADYHLTIDGKSQILNRYVLKNGAATAVVFYWYQGRGRIVANEYAVKWNLLRDAALAGHTEEALVRVVVPVRGAGLPTGDTAAAARIAEADALGVEIASRLTREVSRVLPRT